ncbi:hypothetical protein GEMRC1_003376 [Eukaryota sp. GEM-RC1]
MTLPSEADDTSASICYRFLLTYVASQCFSSSKITLDHILSLGIFKARNYSKHQLEALIQSDPLHQLSCTPHISFTWLHSISQLPDVSCSHSTLFIPLPSDIFLSFSTDSISSISSSSSVPILAFSPENFNELLVNPWYFQFFVITNYASITSPLAHFPSLKEISRGIYYIKSITRDQISDLGRVTSSLTLRISSEKISSQSQSNVRPKSAVVTGYRSRPSSIKPRLDFDLLLSCYQVLAKSNHVMTLEDLYSESRCSLFYVDFVSMLRQDPLVRFSFHNSNKIVKTFF